MCAADNYRHVGGNAGPERTDDKSLHRRHKPEAHSDTSARVRERIEADQWEGALAGQYAHGIVARCGDLSSGG